MGFLFKRRSQGGLEILLPPPANHKKDPFPPKWKPIEECPLYKLGIINRFLHVWDVETRPHMKDSEFPKNGKIPLKKPKNIHKKFRGRAGDYDVDWRPPEAVGSPFYTCNDHYLTKINPTLKQSCIHRANFVIHEINAHAMAQMHDKHYELHSVEKTVEILGNRFSLLTFHVNEAVPNNGDTVVKMVQAMLATRGRRDYKLIEWRFKPQGTEDEDEDEETTSSSSQDNICSTSNPMMRSAFLFAVLICAFSYLLHWFLVARQVSTILTMWCVIYVSFWSSHILDHLALLYEFVHSF